MNSWFDELKFERTNAKRNLEELTLAIEASVAQLAREIESETENQDRFYFITSAKKAAEWKGTPPLTNEEKALMNLRFAVEALKSIMDGKGRLDEFVIQTNLFARSIAALELNPSEAVKKNLLKVLNSNSLTGKKRKLELDEFFVLVKRKLEFDKSPPTKENIPEASVKPLVSNSFPQPQQANVAVADDKLQQSERLKKAVNNYGDYMASKIGAIVTKLSSNEDRAFYTKVEEDKFLKNNLPEKLQMTAYPAQRDIVPQRPLTPEQSEKIDSRISVIKNLNYATIASALETVAAVPTTNIASSEMYQTLKNALTPLIVASFKSKDKKEKALVTEILRALAPIDPAFVRKMFYEELQIYIAMRQKEGTSWWQGRFFGYNETDKLEAAKYLRDSLMTRDQSNVTFDFKQIEVLRQGRLGDIVRKYETMDGKPSISKAEASKTELSGILPRIFPINYWKTMDDALQKLIGRFTVTKG